MTSSTRPSTRLAASVAAKSGLVLAIGKEAFHRQREMSLADAYAYTAEVMAKNLEAADAAEGIEAFLDKRPPSGATAGDGPG